MGVSTSLNTAGDNKELATNALVVLLK